ncbi:MAG: YajQ family cyclic di-GMP-binding protein [Bdellovibrionales bacterium]|nr:YajQ family cyclic di-GMP-binding protein [Bdellovibrionales bacterium]
MPSFDIVSEINIQELDNAVNQARREMESRYDFKGSKSEIQWDRKTITIMADDDYKLNALKDILQSKAHRRGIDLKALRFEKAEAAGGMMWRQPVTLIQGIEKEAAKKIVKTIKDSGLKVQPAVNGDLVRVTSKSIDTLQECMQFLKGASVEVPIQFNNFR